MYESLQNVNQCTLNCEQEEEGLNEMYFHFLCRSTRGEGANLQPTYPFIFRIKQKEMQNNSRNTYVRQ